MSSLFLDKDLLENILHPVIFFGLKALNVAELWYLLQMEVLLGGRYVNHYEAEKRVHTLLVCWTGFKLGVLPEGGPGGSWACPHVECFHENPALVWLGYFCATKLNKTSLQVSFYPVFGRHLRDCVNKQLPSGDTNLLSF